MDTEPDTARSAALPWRIYLLSAWMLLTALFWFLNPGATEGFSSGVRLLFWAVHVGLPLAILQAVQVFLSRFASAVSLAPVWQVVLAGIIGGVVFTPVGLFLDGIFPDPDAGRVQPMLGAVISELSSIVPPVVLVWLAVNAPRLVQPGRVPESAAQERRAEFWSKVPEGLGDDLVSVSAELHYIRVRTPCGEALVLYPFGKAVEELAGEGGLQVHRSHWVKFDHVGEVIPRKEQAEIRLDTGQTLPVSRRYKAEFLQALKKAK
jgi:hypothetical protein